MLVSVKLPFKVGFSQGSEFPVPKRAAFKECHTSLNCLGRELGPREEKRLFQSHIVI
jgi:hypothetical protein